MARPGGWRCRPAAWAAGMAAAAACVATSSADDSTGGDSPCDGIVLTYFGDDSDKSNIGLFIMYGILMAYIFGGVAVAADAFMGAIEAITAETKLVTIGAGSAERDVEVGVWNKTVSNLSLMALGSSAPEILLAIIEVIGNGFKAGDLGPGTIVGSAAFNMLMIIAICVSIDTVKVPFLQNPAPPPLLFVHFVARLPFWFLVASACAPHPAKQGMSFIWAHVAYFVIPMGPAIKVEAIIVLYITAFASVLAYLWLYLMVDVITPQEIYIWEAAVTCAMFPLLLIVSFAADKGWFDGDFCHHKVSKVVGKDVPRHDRAAMKHLVSVGHVPVHATGTSEWNMHLRRAIRKIKRNNPKMSMDEVYVLAFERVKYHDHAPVLIGEIARERAESESREIKANGGTVVPVSPAGASSSGSVTPHRMDSDSQLLAMANGELPEGDTLGPIQIVPVMRSVSSTSSIAPGTCRVGFPQALYKCIEQDGKVLVPVKRRGNLHLGMRVEVKSRDATAVFGRDYSFEKGLVLEFKPQERVKEIAVNIVNHETPHSNHHFFLELQAPAGEGAEVVRFSGANRVTKIRIVDKNGWRGFGQCMRGIFGTITSAEPADSAYLEQIRVALRGGDDEDDDSDDDDEADVTYNPTFPGNGESSADDEGPTNGKGGGEEDGEMGFCGAAWEWFVYLYLVVPSVLLAIFSIPVTYWHGWGAFLTSLMWIGIWTLLAGDLATGMGCTVGLADTVTAITFVALGTSVPDTFASKIAAEQDDSADSAIGNVTGSNAVNVFLGVGLSWLVGAIYQESNGSMFTVKSGALAFSVLLFTICAVVWFSVLTLRRFTVGGELGGKGWPKWATVILFVVMWFFFILLVALVEYEEIDNPF